MTEVKLHASVFEPELLEDVSRMIAENPLLFEGEKVVLMPDAHRGASVPVGFTMTLSKGLVPVDYVGADICCGVTGILIRNYVPSHSNITVLNRLARDVIPVNRRVSGSGAMTDMGTLGNGNHFVEVGTNGKDTLISVHSGSRGYGGELFKKHKEIAIQHSKHKSATDRKVVLDAIEPTQREAYIKTLPQSDKVPLLEVSKHIHYYEELRDAQTFAFRNREAILMMVVAVLFGNAFKLNKKDFDYEYIDTIHNYIDTSGEVPILRKGAIRATFGEKVLIPINMRDGIILGTCGILDELNHSLPHGAGRIMSRSRAFKELSVKDFVSDMEDVASTTVGASTLDESPRAYKSIETILEDLKDDLLEYEIFKPLFNYKGV